MSEILPKWLVINRHTNSVTYYVTEQAAIDSAERMARLEPDKLFEVLRPVKRFIFKSTASYEMIQENLDG